MLRGAIGNGAESSTIHQSIWRPLYTAVLYTSTYNMKASIYSSTIHQYIIYGGLYTQTLCERGARYIEHSPVYMEAYLSNTVTYYAHHRE